MKCLEVRELLPELATGMDIASKQVEPHLAHIGSCVACSAELQELRQIMAVLDEWQVLEPTAYFDTRLMARVREEKTQGATHQGWMAWLRKPVMGMALAMVMVAGVAVYRNVPASGDKPVVAHAVIQPQRGTAVADLQALDENPDMYSDFDVLDELQPQDATQNQ